MLCHTLTSYTTRSDTTSFSNGTTPLSNIHLKNASHGTHNGERYPGTTTGPNQDQQHMNTLTTTSSQPSDMLTTLQNPHQ
ncbi:hypothetical protein F8M41_005023 [Gigaspora margarita]|uniref:Uncharacterized protein n=1 Tax=Gigaspora margarita TaxID=4874 RepID=A0A8H3X9J5_GIGMA|nr:hypothetical protein F8M41_005023 [Gigaspora margarita]